MFSVGERTFRFTRSPAWDRPRQRSGGTRRIQAHVVAEEHRDGDWSTLTNRLDEAGQLVTSLLGMTCAQFTQVAMLPQGRFQAFLRATSGERHAVLQRLFRTRRFEDVERWLVDRRIGLRRRSQTMHDRCAGRAQPFPGGCRGRRTRGVGRAGPDRGRRRRVADGLGRRGVCRQRGRRCRGAAPPATTSARASPQRRTELDEATATRRGAGARRAGLALPGRPSTRPTTPSWRWRARSTRHGRAAPVLPLARQSDQAHQDLESAEREAARHREAVTALLGPAAPVEADELGLSGAQRRRGRLPSPGPGCPGSRSSSASEPVVEDLAAEATTLAARGGGR